MSEQVLPNGASALPEDYLSYIQSMKGELELPMIRLYTWPREPGVAMGRQGYENFQYSVLVGARKDAMQAILKYDSKSAAGGKVWQYSIVQGAEWSVFREFASFADMLRYLKRETVISPAPISRSTRNPSKRR